MKKLFLLISFLLLSWPLYAATDFTQDANCILAYTLEESSGNADDKCSGGTNDGTATDITYSVAGKYGDAFDYNDSTSRLNAGDIAEIDTATELSVCAWLYHDTISTDDAIVYKNNGVTDGFLFWRDDTGNDYNDSYEVFLADGSDTSNQRAECTSSTSATTWTHVCMIFKAATHPDGVKIYMDGSSCEDEDNTLGIASINTNGTYPLTIGMASDESSAPYDGRIDEVIVLDRTLSGAEVTNIMNDGIDGAQAGGGGGGGDGRSTTKKKSFLLTKAKLSKKWKTPGNYGYVFLSGFEN